MPASFACATRSFSAARSPTPANSWNAWLSVILSRFGFASFFNDMIVLPRGGTRAWSGVLVVVIHRGGCRLSDTVLLAERLVDIHEHLLLTFVDRAVGQDRRCDLEAAITLVEDARAYIKGLCGDPQALRDLLENLSRRLAQAALDLAQIGVGDTSGVRELPDRELCDPPLLAKVVAKGSNLERRHGASLPGPANNCKQTCANS